MGVKAKPIVPLTDEQRKLAEENQGLVYKAVIDLCKHHPWLDYDEAVSEGLYALVRAAKGYDPARAKFSTYVYKAVRREVARALVGVGIPNRELVRLDLLPGPKDASVETADHLDVARKNLQRVLASLSPREVQVLRLYYEEGWILERIGTLWGRSKERARQVLLRALQKARDYARSQGLRK